MSIVTVKQVKQTFKFGQVLQVSKFEIKGKAPFVESFKPYTRNRNSS